MENKVTHEYTKELKINEVPLVAELKSYENPVRKSQSVECHTNLDIKCGNLLWGQMAFANPTSTQEEADTIFEKLITNPELFKL